ncbi:hypothetical protein [Hoyosella altamirensis]|uniref:Uncharacterized protein n=1 Tax=Hoyosella altamirensis TaxID=616997 RepID=A0A839RUW3_9ACTN|nr:hypothetical protein [Hoyosella altamirensis]MBB3039591.1 hypothetical protein [Hoyosella altamirensis]
MTYENPNNDYPGLVRAALDRALADPFAPTPMGDQMDAALAGRRYSPAAAFDPAVAQAVRHLINAPAGAASPERLYAAGLNTPMFSNQPDMPHGMYSSGLEAQVIGPVGVRRVRWADVAACESWGTEWPVPPAYSVFRVCRRILWHFARTCKWCRTGVPDPYIGMWGMVVSMGASVGLFGTCTDCWQRFNDSTNGTGFDFVGVDDWEHDNGWPVDAMC